MEARPGKVERPRCHPVGAHIGHGVLDELDHLRGGLDSGLLFSGTHDPLGVDKHSPGGCARQLSDRQGVPQVGGRLERKTNRPICCPAGWLIPEKSAEFSESIC